jgi:hypothetical protein
VGYASILSVRKENTMEHVTRSVNPEHVSHMKSAVYWYVTQRDCYKNIRFGGKYGLHHQGEKNLRARNNVSSN